MWNRHLKQRWTKSVTLSWWYQYLNINQSHKHLHASMFTLVCAHWRNKIQNLTDSKHSCDNCIKSSSMPIIHVWMWVHISQSLVVAVYSAADCLLHMRIHTNIYVARYWVNCGFSICGPWFHSGDHEKLLNPHNKLCRYVKRQLVQLHTSALAVMKSPKNGGMQRMCGAFEECRS